jgi:hypothetical protein
MFVQQAETLYAPTYFCEAALRGWSKSPALLLMVLLLTNHTYLLLSVPAAFPNVQCVKVLRDRQTGNSRGMAFVVSTCVAFVQTQRQRTHLNMRTFCCFPAALAGLSASRCASCSVLVCCEPSVCLQDFASVDDARALMESEQRYDMAVGGRRLLLDYSHGAPSGRAADATGAAALDWICDMCSAVNFAR